MTLPNFLIIGAAKSGTTALDAYLRQHPDIFMSTPKELRFFSYSGPYPPDLPEVYTHRGVTTFEEYQTYFEGTEGYKIIGEASPMYLYYPWSAERIKQTLSNDVKLLAILRNPVDRAFSSYTHAMRDWIEPAQSFEEALSKEQERIDAGWGILWHYTKAGFYFEQLSRYYQIFRPEQIKAVLYDDLVADPHKLIHDIFTFLEVDPTFQPDLSSRPNVSGFPKNPAFHEWMRRLFMEDNPIKRISRKIFPKSFRQKVMVDLREKNLEKRVMPEEIRRQLHDLFAEDTKQLEKLLDRDLSKWLGYT